MEILEAIKVEEYESQVECPHCQQSMDVCLKAVVAEEVVICHICGQNIKLVDMEGATKKFVVKINQLLGNFDQQLGGLAKA